MASPGAMASGNYHGKIIEVNGETMGICFLDMSWDIHGPPKGYVISS